MLFLDILNRTSRNNKLGIVVSIKDFHCRTVISVKLFGSHPYIIAFRIEEMCFEQIFWNLQR